ncbi:MFS transporter [Nakamurella aerolata]|uniref:MFS transporter n=1 Tax=Nakamurella aerolata TaxID=1656892 RepID=A0A849AD44_9ACTN|nr:MFS transporter [Nakamurella aerolata]NNG37121.1 MFS transporter [Nakamurella aerolata]
MTAFLALCLAFAMIQLDVTVVYTALPAIGDSLQAPAASLTWVVDAYTIAFAALLVTGGALGDRLGGRRVFQLGLLLFGLASAACAAAPNLAVLAVARLVQGIGAAVALPTSLSLLNVAYPDAERRNRMVAWWAAVGSIAAAIGPVLGGTLTDLLGWRSLFLVNVPVVALGVLLVRKALPPDADRNPATGSRLDPIGQLLAALALGAGVAAIIERSVPLAAIGVAAAAAFVLAERRVRHPMIPGDLFAHNEFRAAIFVGAALNFGTYGQLFLMAFYFQRLQGYSPSQAGLATTPELIASIAAAVLATRLLGRFGRMPLIIAGTGIATVGLLVLAIFHRPVGYALLLGPIMAIGFGTALAVPAATATALTAGGSGYAGVASGLFNASRQFGGSIGLAVFGALTAATFLPGFRLSMLCGAAVMISAALATALATRRSGRGRRGTAVDNPESPGTGQLPSNNGAQPRQSGRAELAIQGRLRRVGQPTRR